MALKKVKAKETASKNVGRKEEIKNLLKDIEVTILNLQNEKTTLQEEALSIDIAPFKIGDYALAEVSSGRSKKWQKCLLECESGYLYVRPVKEDGELSGRHFSIIPFGEQKYSDFLKEVK